MKNAPMRAFRLLREAKRRYFDRASCADPPMKNQVGLTRRARLNMQALVACMFFVAQPSQSAIINFCWAGAGGYTMTGQMTIPDAAMTKPLITENDVVAFEINGFHDGQAIGSWRLQDKRDDTTWHLRFAPRDLRFLTGQSFRTKHSQGWNANGAVNDCGTPGFGFNSGNFAQDVCVDGVYARDSSIAPDAPFFATYDPVIPECRKVPALS